VNTADEQGWSTVINGDLIRLAEQQGYQQNLQSRTIAILVLTTTSWPPIKAAAALVVDVVARIRSGDYRELCIP
jgi:hypothetical protein